MVVRDAATVMLVRDRPAGGVEVLLLQRNLRSDFVGGAHVFPGGALDLADGDPVFSQLCVGRGEAECSARLGSEGGGLAFWVAAVRECFEEAGVLLARRPDDDDLVSFADPAVAARFVGHRAALNRGRPFAEVLAAEGLVLDVGRLHHVSHWVTPEGASRRYDTRFFLAAAPAHQVPRHDDGETIDSLWIDPADALARHRLGDLSLLLPTIRNLELLASFTTVDQVLAAAEAMDEVPTIRPRLVPDGAGMRILLPGDAGYDQAGLG